MLYITNIFLQYILIIFNNSIHTYLLSIDLFIKYLLSIYILSIIIIYLMYI